MPLFFRYPCGYPKRRSTSHTLSTCRRAIHFTSRSRGSRASGSIRRLSTESKNEPIDTSPVARSLKASVHMQPLPVTSPSWIAISMSYLTLPGCWRVWYSRAAATRLFRIACCAAVCSCCCLTCSNNCSSSIPNIFAISVWSGMSGEWISRTGLFQYREGPMIATSSNALFKLTMN